MKPRRKPHEREWNRSNPQPDRLGAHLDDVELEEGEAGWAFSAYAQLFGVVNDRLMRFHAGSFLKTFQERVPTGSVKLHDGHNRGLTASGTYGRITAGTEDEKGARVDIFISRAHPEVAVKVDDGTLTELSVEVFRMKQDLEGEADIEEIPEPVRRFAELTPSGKVRVADIFEVRLDAVGLVSGSSQGKNVILEPPTVITFQDLPVARSNFNPGEAAERLSAWAGVDASRRNAQGDPMANYARLSRGYLVTSGGDLLGQIGDVLDGELVVSSEALEGAHERLVEALSGRLEGSALSATLAAAARQIGRYEEKLSRSGLTPEAKTDTLTTKSTATAGAEPPPAGTHSDAGSERATKLQQLSRRFTLTDLDLRMSRGVTPHEPVGTSQGDQGTG